MNLPDTDLDTSAGPSAISGVDRGPEAPEHIEYRTGFLLQLEIFFQTFIAAYAGLNELMPVVRTDNFRECLRNAFDNTFDNIFEPPGDGQAPTLSRGVTNDPLFHKVALALVDEFANKAQGLHSNENYPEALQYLFLATRCADMADCGTPDKISGLYRAILRDSIGCECRVRKSFDDLIEHCERLFAPEHRGFASRETPYRELCPKMPDSYLDVDIKAMATYPLAYLIRYAMQAASACDWGSVLFFQEILADNNPKGFSSNYHLAVVLESRAIQLERLGEFNDALRCLEEAVKTREFLRKAAMAVCGTVDAVTVRNFDTRRNCKQIEILRKRQEIVRANFEANERYGHKKNEPSSVDEAGWPEYITKVTRDMIGDCPTEILLRYSEQAERNTNPDVVGLRILINIEIAKRRPGVYLNQLVLSWELARLGRIHNELLARIAMEELYPSTSADSPNIRIIDQIVKLLKGTEALRHPVIARRLGIALCRAKGEPLSYASTAVIVEVRGPGVTLLSRERLEELVGAVAATAEKEPPAGVKELAGVAVARAAEEEPVSAESTVETSGPVGQARAFIEIDEATRKRYERLRAEQRSQRAARGRLRRGDSAAIPEAASPLYGSPRDRETCRGFLQSLRSTMIRHWRCIRDEIFAVPAADREDLIRNFEDLRRTVAAGGIGGVGEYVSQILRTVMDSGEIDAGMVRNLTETFPRDRGRISLRLTGTPMRRE